MPKRSKLLARIARTARHKAVRAKLAQFDGDRSRTAKHFDVTTQAIGQILARK